jgi:hypothetical protein
MAAMVAAGVWALKKFADIDWDALRRTVTSQGVKDFDSFLDALPLNVGVNALIAAGIAWLVAGTSVFFTSMEISNVSHLRAEVAKVGALKPPVPVIKYDPVPEAQVAALQKKITETYKGIHFIGSTASMTISAEDTDYFPQFLAAVSTLQNGGKNWRVTISSMCVGLDCVGSKLSAVLKIETARIAEAPKDDAEAGAEDKK